MKPDVAYHHENPHIYLKFEEFTLKTIKKGFSHYSAKGIFEIIRWHTGISGNDAWKVNNNYTSLYARLFSEKHPQHKDFFRTRKSKFDQKGQPIESL